MTQSGLAGPAHRRPVRQPGSPQPEAELRRTLGVGDAVVIGLGSMVGAGIFAALGPAARAAGSGLLLGLARRRRGRVLQRDVVGAARRPAIPRRAGPMCTGGSGSASSGGIWRAGRSSSARPPRARRWRSPWARTSGRGRRTRWRSAAVVALTAVNYGGVQKSAWLTRAIVAVVLAVLAAVVVVCLASGDADAGRLDVRGLRGRGRACFRRPDCCSSPSRGTRGSRRSARRCGIRRAPSRARSRWRWASRWWCTRLWRWLSFPCWGRVGSGRRRRRWPTRYGRPGCRGWSRSCGSVPPWPRSARCSR